MHQIFIPEKSREKGEGLNAKKKPKRTYKEDYHRLSGSAGRWEQKYNSEGNLRGGDVTPKKPRVLLGERQGGPFK